MSVLRLNDGTICRTGPTCRLHGNLHTFQEQVYATYAEKLREQESQELHDLKDQTPIQIDSKLAELDSKKYTHLVAAHQITQKLNAMEKREEALRRRLGDRYETTSNYADVYQKNVDFYNEKYVEEMTKSDAYSEQMKVYDQEYTRRGGWSRAFFVANGNGHVHKEMSCSTCYARTKFLWLTQYSGKNEEEIVDDAGDRACTTCYPSAPVDVLSRASRIENPERVRAAAEREAKRQAKEEAARIKGITTPQGEPLKLRWGVVKTERTAEIETVENMLNLKILSASSDINSTHLQEIERYAETGLAALAHKHRTTIEEERARLNVKVERKFRQASR